MKKDVVAKTVASQVRQRVQEKPLGTVFLVRDFLDVGTSDTIARTLARLSREGILRRVGHGLYESPRISPLLGKAAPSDPAAIAAAMARRIGGEIAPAEAQVANALHLTTQVPAKSIYRTNTGKVRRARVGNHTIELRPATARYFPKNHSEGVIGGLRFVGQQNVTDEMIEMLHDTLNGEQKQELRQKIPDAPAWMQPLLKRIVSDEETR